MENKTFLQCFLLVLTLLLIFIPVFYKWYKNTQTKSASINKLIFRLTLLVGLFMLIVVPFVSEFNHPILQYLFIFICAVLYVPLLANWINKVST